MRLEAGESSYPWPPESTYPRVLMHPRLVVTIAKDGPWPWGTFIEAQHHVLLHIEQVSVAEMAIRQNDSIPKGAGFPAFFAIDGDRILFAPTPHTDLDVVVLP